MTLVLDDPAKPHIKHWTKREYNAMVDRGSFEGKRIFLFRGRLIEMPPMGSLHSFGVTNITEWLVSTFAPAYRVRIQQPFETPGETMPEPDGAVVTPEQMRIRPHPKAAELLIEVSDSSIELDREKAFDYAAALVPEYWIVDVRSRAVEVYRDPVADPSAILGFRYASHHVHQVGDMIASLLRPESPVAVEQLTNVE